MLLPFDMTFHMNIFPSTILSRPFDRCDPFLWDNGWKKPGPSQAKLLKDSRPRKALFCMHDGLTMKTICSLNAVDVPLHFELEPSAGSARICVGLPPPAQMHVSA